MVGSREFSTREYVRCRFLPSLFAFLFLLPSIALGQKEFLVISYNVENFLAPTFGQDSSHYIPPIDRISVRHFKEKALAVSQAIRLSAAGHRLGLIGLCEIDSRRVLSELVYQTPLKQGNYSILHRDSPDHRGIDVALLYQRDLLRLQNVRWIPIRLQGDTAAYPTRELLYASFRLPYADTLHVVQCHLPSQMTAREKPFVVQTALAHLQMLLDSVRERSPEASIVVMGDMNMPVADVRLKQVACGQAEEAITQRKLVNWALLLPDSLTYPTYRYLGKWSTIDAFLVSPSLLDSTAWHCAPYSFDYAPLLEKDLEHGGYKPRRTRKGVAFRAGYSDHLPIGVVVKYQ